MRTRWILVFILLVVSCRPVTAPISISHVEVAPPETRTLRLGETIPFSGVEIAFTSVLADSRCPTDVLCPWAGNAAIELGVGPGTGPTYSLVLNTNAEPRQGQASGLRITLLEVRPSPVSTEQIPPNAYEIVLLIDASAGEPARRIPRRSQAADVNAN